MLLCSEVFCAEFISVDADSTNSRFLFTAPYKLAATGGTSETPAWRNTIAHVAVTSAWSVERES